MQILWWTGHCFVCLRRNHTSCECFSTLGCGKRSGRHHMSICGDSQQTTSVVNTPSRGNSSQSPWGLQQPTLQDSARSFLANNTTFPLLSVLWCVDVRVPVLLQTARTTVIQNLQSRQEQGVTKFQIIFDTRSQRSYITETVKNC